MWNRTAKYYKRQGFWFYLNKYIGKTKLKYLKSQIKGKNEWLWFLIMVMITYALKNFTCLFLGCRDFQVFALRCWRGGCFREWHYKQCLALCNQLKYPSGKLIYKHISGIQYWDLAGLQHRPAGKKERHRRQGREGYPFSVHVKFGVYNSSTLGFLWGDFWGLPRHLLQLKHLGPDREGHAGPTPPTTGTA